MRLLETSREAVSALRANKLRSSLTLLGMVIGVFAVIAAVTAVDVIDLYFKSSIQGLGASTLSVERYDFGNNEEQYHPPLTYRQTMRLKDQMGGAFTVSVEESFDGGVKAQSAREETNPNISLYGTDQAFLGNFGYDMQAGRPFAEQDVQNARPVALLGSAVADALFPAASPIGKEVKIGRVRLEGVGVLASRAEERARAEEEGGDWCMSDAIEDTAGMGAEPVPLLTDADRERRRQYTLPLCTVPHEDAPVECSSA